MPLHRPRAELKALRTRLRRHSHRSLDDELRAARALLADADRRKRRDRIRARGGVSDFERLPAESLELVVDELARSMPLAELKSYALVSHRMAHEVRRHVWRNVACAHASRTSLRRLVELLPVVGACVQRLNCTQMAPLQLGSSLPQLRHLAVDFVQPAGFGHNRDSTGAAFVEAIRASGVPLISLALSGYQAPVRDHPCEDPSPKPTCTKNVMRKLIGLVGELRTLQSVVLRLHMGITTWHALIRALASLPALTTLCLTGCSNDQGLSRATSRAIVDTAAQPVFPALAVLRIIEVDINDVPTTTILRLCGAALERFECLRASLRTRSQFIDDNSADADDPAADTSGSDLEAPQMPYRPSLGPRRRPAPPARFDEVPACERLRGLRIVRLDTSLHLREEQGLGRRLAAVADAPNVEVLELDCVSVFFEDRQGVPAGDILSFLRLRPFPRLRIVRLYVVDARVSGRRPTRWLRDDAGRQLVLGLTPSDHDETVAYLRDELLDLGLELQFVDEQCWLDWLALAPDERRYLVDGA